MRFSIRAMLALMFLAGLATLVWRASVKARRDEARMARLRDEIESLEATVRLDQPALHQAILHTRDQFESLRLTRERAVEQFGALQKKYRVMQPPAVGVLSLRRVPALRTDAGASPVVFRLLVPAERPVWLKFGVHQMPRSMSLNRALDEANLMADSAFDANGPYEIRLPAGDQTLKIAIGAAEEGSLPVVISLNDEVLVRSTYQSPGVGGTSSSHVAGLQQIDYGPDRPLPWLLSARISVRQQPSATAGDSPVGFSIWMSDSSSNFASFPGP